jgi:hypothetical protein
MLNLLLLCHTKTEKMAVTVDGNMLQLATVMLSREQGGRSATEWRMHSRIVAAS